MVCANKCDLSPRQVDEIEGKLWAELRGFQLFETSALTGEGVNDMFHAFFSMIVKARDDGADGLPSTPSTARKVKMSASSSSLLNKSKSNSSVANSEKKCNNSPQPSPEQKTVMQRLKEGRDPWQRMGLVKGCASRDEVNKVFRKLAALLHPDKTAVVGADEAFKALGVARRDILKQLGAVT